MMQTTVNKSSSFAVPKSKRKESVKQSKRIEESLPILSPPLPLVKFLNEYSSDVKTISGENLRTVSNQIPSFSAKISKPIKLFDPVLSRKLCKWFVARSQKETNHRQVENYSRYFFDSQSDETSSRPEIFDYLVYESFLYMETLAERLQRNELRKNEEQIYRQRFNHFNSSQVIEGKDITTSSRRGSLSSTVESNSQEQDESGNISIKDNDEIDSVNIKNDGENTPSLLAQLKSEGKISRGVEDKASSESPSIIFSPSLTFDSEFESGNLETATRVIGRETLINKKMLNFLNDYQSGSDVDQEYDLVLRNDINTSGNIQWYYFSVTSCAEATSGQITTYPLRVRFNITNMQKKDSLYNYGMKPAILDCIDESSEWSHGGYDICYYKNGSTSMKPTNKNEKKKQIVRNLYTLTFSYTFNQPGTVFFAHSFPYTYTDLQRYLDALERDERVCEFFHRRSLCETLAGNRCDLLTITERAQGISESKNKSAVILSARVHPGETNSSYVMHGLIEFLCSESQEAAKLRSAFIFTIVPMLNPDGVIHGNYRCSLAGTDLNRRYGDCHATVHPTISAYKSLIRSIQSNRNVSLFIDLHGHSKMKNSFTYGCDVILQSEKQTKLAQAKLVQADLNARRIHCRVFPKVLSSVSNSAAGGYFSFQDSSFAVHKSKGGTGRVFCWRELGILGSYTIEMSFCGNGNNNETRILKKLTDRLHSSGLRSADGADQSDADSGCKLDSELLDLLSSYEKAVHYQKTDLTLMGKHIALAIYHYGNLPHVDLEYERSVIAQTEKEHREKIRQAEATRDSLLKAAFGLERPKSAAMPYKPRSNSASIGSSDVVKYTFPDRGNISKLLMEGKDLVITPSAISGFLEVSSRTMSQDKSDVKSAVRTSNAAILKTPSADLEVVDDESEESDEDSVASSASGIEKAITSGALETANKSIQVPVVMLDDEMRFRPLLASSVFSIGALEVFSRLFPKEFSSPAMTANLGMRVKCEIAIRKALNLTESLDMERFQISSEDGIGRCGSDDGSDSCPSVDNGNSAKLLSNLSKYKNANSLVFALRNSIARKKKREEEEVKKREKKAEKSLSRQAAIAKQAELDRLALEQQRERERAAAAAAAAAAASAAKPAPQPLEKRFKRPPVAPTPFVPVYRLDQTKVSVPTVQIKLMNFSDLDQSRSKVPRSRERRATAYDPSSLLRQNSSSLRSVNPAMSMLSIAADASLQSPPATLSHSISPDIYRVNMNMHAAADSASASKPVSACPSPRIAASSSPPIVISKSSRRLGGEVNAYGSISMAQSASESALSTALSTQKPNNALPDAGNGKRPFYYF